MTQTSSLTAQQQQVLALIASGFNATTAAEHAGVHRNTIAYWLRSEEFREALESARGEKEILYWDQAEVLAAEAIHKLRALADDPQSPATVRLRATLAMLDHAQRFLPDTCAIVTAPAAPAQPTAIEENEEKRETVHKNAQKNERSENQPLAPDPRPLTPAREARPKPGRNDLCPCGSGIKFKRCCLGKAPVPAANAA